MKLNLNLARRPYVHRRALFASYGIVLGCLLLVLILNLNYALRLREATSKLEVRLAEMRDRFESPDDNVPVDISEIQLKELAENVAFANEVLDRDAFRWTTLLNRLEDISPAGITVTSLTPDFKTREVELNGLARDVEALRRFLDRLLASDSFADTYLLSQDIQKVKDSRDQEREAVAFAMVLKGAF